MKATVIISNYQGIRFLPKCLRHVMNQTYPDYEVLLLDAGSTDGSPEFVETSYPDVRLFRCGRIGIGEAINIGIQNSSGEIIVFDLNTDEYVEPNWLDELINQLAKYDFNIITGTTRIIYGTDLIDEAGVELNFFGKAKLLGHGKKIDHFDFPHRSVDYVGSPAFHRKLLTLIGPIDEDYFIYGEDADFCYRAKLAGIETRCAPLARSYHHVRGTTGKNIRTLEYFLRRAYLKVHISFSSPPRVIINFLYLAFFLELTALIASLCPIQKSTLYHEKLIGRTKALMWYLRTIKENLIKRRRFKQMRLKRKTIRMKTCTMDTDLGLY